MSKKLRRRSEFYIEVIILLTVIFIIVSANFVLNVYNHFNQPEEIPVEETQILEKEYAYVAEGEELFHYDMDCINLVNKNFYLITFDFAFENNFLECENCK